MVVKWEQGVVPGLIPSAGRMATALFQRLGEGFYVVLREYEGLAVREAPESVAQNHERERERNVNERQKGKVE